MAPAGLLLNVASAGLIGHGAVVLSTSANNLGKDIANMSAGGGSGGKAGDYKFPKSNNDMEKVFGVNEKTFHKEIKPEVIKEINRDPVWSKEFKKMGNNPDIGVDDFGNVVLKDVRTGKTLPTDIPSKSFLP